MAHCETTSTFTCYPWQAGLWRHYSWIKHKTDAVIPRVNWHMTCCANNKIQPVSYRFHFLPAVGTRLPFRPFTPVIKIWSLDKTVAIANFGFFKLWIIHATSEMIDKQTLSNKQYFQITWSSLPITWSKQLVKIIKFEIYACNINYFKKSELFILVPLLFDSI